MISEFIEDIRHRQTCSVKGQIVNAVGFAGRTVSERTAQLGCCRQSVESIKRMSVAVVQYIFISHAGCSFLILGISMSSEGQEWTFSGCGGLSLVGTGPLSNRGDDNH